jgi:hypothetical protein
VAANAPLFAVLRKAHGYLAYLLFLTVPWCTLRRRCSMG